MIRQGAAGSLAAQAELKFTPRPLARVPLAPPVRRGATLTEVLMSLLIMSIGVTSVFTLFPLALVSSIRATQLTNAKILEDNVRERIKSNPQLVEGYPQWGSNKLYATVTNPSGTNNLVGNLACVPSPKPGHILSSTNLIFVPLSSAPPSASLQGSVTSGWREPAWPLFWSGTIGTATDNGQSGWAWGGYHLPDLVNLNAPSPAAADSVYVIDPLGYWNSTDAGGTNYSVSTASVRTRFGNDEAMTAYYQNTNSGFPSLMRHHANLTWSQANQLFWLPDSWSVYVEDIPLNVTAGATSATIDFASTVDLSGLSSGSLTLPAAPPLWPSALATPTSDTSLFSRATVRSATGAQTATLPISAWTSNQITLVGALPASLDSLAEIGTVRIETYTPRYSYLLTVRRKPSGEAQVSCPIFFNRTFSLQDERVYDAAFYGDSVQVIWTSSPAPLIKEGGYLFDATSGYWYQMISVSGTTSPVTIVLNRTAAVQNASLFDYSSGVMFLPGIVKVFDMKLQ